MATFEERLAEQVVTRSLALQEGEEFLIHTWQHTIPLAEALYVEAAKAGAFPHLELFTDEAYRRYLAEVPEAYLRKPSPLGLREYEVVNAIASLGGPEDPSIFRKMPPERMGAMEEAFRPFHEKVLERKIRNANVELGQVTPQRAARYGVAYEAGCGTSGTP